MKSVEFCYWLQGLFELSNPRTLNTEQTKQIRQHLALVFKHEIDPSYGNSSIQDELQKIHDGPGFNPSDTMFRC